MAKGPRPKQEPAVELDRLTDLWRPTLGAGGVSEDYPTRPARGETLVQDPQRALVARCPTWASGLGPRACLSCSLLIQQVPGRDLRPPTSASELGVHVLPKEAKGRPGLHRHRTPGTTLAFPVIQKTELACGRAVNLVHINSPSSTTICKQCDKAGHGVFSSKPQGF